MKIDRKNILLFMPLDIIDKYVPRFDYKSLGYTDDERRYIAENFHKQNFDLNRYRLRYSWDLDTPFQEKKLRTLDCFGGVGCNISNAAFFINSRLLECWHALIDKDLQLLPVECYTKNGPVTEFHLVKVINEVDGLDPELTCDVPYSTFYHREVPKATNDFMNGAQIAKERTWDFGSNFYITPELVEKTLKYLHKKKLKMVYIMTFKEKWEWLYGGYADCPPYSADYTGMENKKSS